MTPSSNITELLANLSLAWILAVVAGLTVVRLGVVRLPSPAGRSLAELVESGLIAIVLVFLVIRPFIVQAFFIPTPSMVPTLVGNNGVGDHILVNKFAYRFHAPHHDDVVVFLAPPAALDSEEAQGGNTDFIKRLIAAPGDRLQTVAGKVIVDGRTYSHAEVRAAVARGGLFGADAANDMDGSLLAEHHVKFVADGVLADGKQITKPQLAQLLGQPPTAVVSVQPGYNLLNGKRLNEPFIAEDPDYDMQLFDGKPLKHDYSLAQAEPEMEYKLAGQSLSPAEYAHDLATPPGAIPGAHYFMMGDNRNDSKDSTEWGPLEASRVVGEAQFIFWPLSRMHAVH